MLRTDFITLVCGFPRCGSSMTMQMLNAGGLPLHFNLGNRTSFEATEVSTLPGNWKWMEKVRGKGLKVLEPFEFRPPPGFPYKVIWLDRDLKQQAKSNVKFMRLVGIPVPSDYRHQLAASFKASRQMNIDVLNRLSGYKVLICTFERTLSDPLAAAKRMEAFLGYGLDVEAMAKVVIPRGSDCLDGMLEYDLMMKEKGL